MNPVIPAFAPYGLDRVPAPHGPDAAWRADWKTWRAEVAALALRINERARRDPAFQRNELAICAEDPAYWANTYTWIFEPRVLDDEEPIKQYIQFPFQVQLLQDLVRLVGSPRRADLFVSKCRELGISWTVAQFSLWAWLFTDWSGLLVSRKEEEVDAQGDVDTLFGKIDFLYAYLPAWMKPAGFDPEEHRTKRRLQHPTKAHVRIRGEATTTKTGRGRRATYVVYDEAAFIPDWTEVFDTGAGTTHHRICVSTESFEEGRHWWTMWRANRDNPPNQVREYDWWLNPYFDAAWRADKIRAFAHEPEKFEREYGRNPFAGESGMVYPTAADLPLRPDGYDPTKLLLVGIDPGHHDDTAIVWGQMTERNGQPGIHWLGSYERNLVPAQWYAHLLTGVPPEPGDECWGLPITEREDRLMTFFRDLPWDSGRVRVFMDPAGAQKHNGTSFYDIFYLKSSDLRRRGGDPDQPRRRGIVPYYKTLQGSARFHDERRLATRTYLAHSSFRDEPSALRIREALSHYQFGKVTGKSATEPKPIHDDWSHLVSAVEYVSSYVKLGLGDVKRIRRAKADDRPSSRRRHAPLGTPSALLMSP